MLGFGSQRLVATELRDTQSFTKQPNGHRSSEGRPYDVFIRSVRPYTSIVRPLNVLFQSTAAVLIEDLSGLPMDVQRLHKVEHQISHM